MFKGIKPTDKLVFDLKMKQVERNDEKIKSLEREIADKYNVPIENVKVNFVPITVSENGERISLVSDKINSIHIPEYQQSLFKEWLELNDITDFDFDKLVSIDKQVNAYVDFDEYSKYKEYKFKYVKWDNFLSYGKGNYFDFTKLHDLVLLNSYPENQSGKTTFAVELVRFALFGKSNKVPTLDKAFNSYLSEETTVLVEACIEIDNIDYVIRRTLERPTLSKRTSKSKIKQKVEYFRLLNGELEEIENCEGESNTETNSIIKDAVGTVDDFDLVISATMKTLSDLLDMGQTDKSRLFAKWLGLLTIEKKSEIAKKIWKDDVSRKLLSNTYNRETLNAEIENYKLCIDNDKETIKGLEITIKETAEKINEKEKERDSEYKKRREIDNSVIGLDAVTIDNNIEEKNNEIENKNAIIESLKKELSEKSNITFSDEEYKSVKTAKEAALCKKNETAGKIGELRGKIISLRKDNERINELISKNVCPTCGHPIDIGEQMSFINKNKEEEGVITSEGLKYKQDIENLNNKVSEYDSLILKMENDRDTVNECQKTALRITAIESNIKSLNFEIDRLKVQRDLVNKNRENIEHNNNIENTISIINVEINESNKIVNRCTGEKESLAREIRMYGEEIEKRENVIEKLIQEEKVIRDWNIYQELVGKNGITKIVLKGALPILNNEIARLLDGVCDFDVKLDMDDKNNVTINLHKDGVVMDLGTCASGFEGTVASLALRSALGNMSSVSKSNMLVLDEVLGGVGVSNYDNLLELYKRIAMNYQFILHITHNELLYDWHNQHITVKKDGNISTIEFK